MNTNPNPYLDPEKTARYQTMPRLRSSGLVQNEYFGKIRRELRSERRHAEDKVLCLAVLLSKD